MSKQRPGRKPTDAPKRTARLIIQVLPAEYEQVLAATSGAGYSNYSDYVRERLGLAPVTRRPAPPTGAEGETR